jgi:hypothetical protein
VQDAKAAVAGGAVCVPGLEHARGRLRRPGQDSLATAEIKQQRLE